MKRWIMFWYASGLFLLGLAACTYQTTPIIAVLCAGVAALFILIGGWLDRDAYSITRAIVDYTVFTPHTSNIQTSISLYMRGKSPYLDEELDALLVPIIDFLHHAHQLYCYIHPATTLQLPGAVHTANLLQAHLPLMLAALDHACWHQPPSPTRTSSIAQLVSDLTSATHALKNDLTDLSAIQNLIQPVRENRSQF